MGIYELEIQNELFASHIITVGIGIDVPQLNQKKFADLWATSSEDITNILTWGCMDSSITFVNTCSSKFAEENTSPRIRKVDLKKKKQWLD